MQVRRWKYDFRGGPDLSCLFEQVSSFDEVLQRVVEAAVVLCCHICNAEHRAGYRRVQYAIDVSNEAFELFFNSEFGYRGAYFDSPPSGLAANTKLIRALLPTLRSYESGAEAADDEFVDRSLMGESAKIWVAEPASDVKNCNSDGCTAEWRFELLEDSETALIFNDRWEFSDHEHGAGRYAPHLSKLIVFGAFVNDRGSEWIPERKIERALHLHKYGWA